jgi:hydrogenase-4 component F
MMHIIEVFLLLGLPVLMGAVVFVARFYPVWQKGMLVTAATAHLAAVAGLWFRPSGGKVFNAFLGIDAASQIVLTIVSVLFFLIALYLCGFLTVEKARAHTVFMGCLLFLLAAMTLVTFSRHMGLLWIAAEATTLLSAALINFYHNPQSIEATWKYLLISSLGIAMALLGTFFLAISAAQVTTIFLDDLFAHAPEFSLPWLKLSIIFLVMGYGTKMGLAPMHTWKPDVYGEAPAPIGALMSGALTSCGFLAFFRVAQICAYAHLEIVFSSIFILLGILSMAIGAIFIIKQKDFSRLLGYSSVEHMGIVVLGVGLGGSAVWASFFHLINNALIKGLIFLAAGNIYRRYQTKKAAEIQGSIHAVPASSVFLIMALIAVSGFPPFGIFYSEFLILKEILAQQRYGIAFGYFLFLTVVFFGYARIGLNMVFGKAPDKAQQFVKEQKWEIWPLVILSIVLCFVSIVFPAPLSRIITQASMLLGGG